MQKCIQKIHSARLTRYLITNLGNPVLRTGRFVTTFPDSTNRELGGAIIINNAIVNEVTVLHCPLESVTL